MERFTSLEISLQECESYPLLFLAHDLNQIRSKTGPDSLSFTADSEENPVSMRSEERVTACAKFKQRKGVTPSKPRTRSTDTGRKIKMKDLKEESKQASPGVSKKLRAKLYFQLHPRALNCVFQFLLGAAPCQCQWDFFTQKHWSHGNKDLQCTNGKYYYYYQHTHKSMSRSSEERVLSLRIRAEMQGRCQGCLPGWDLSLCHFPKILRAGVQTERTGITQGSLRTVGYLKPTCQRVWLNWSEEKVGLRLFPMSLLVILPCHEAEHHAGVLKPGGRLRASPTESQRSAFLALIAGSLHSWTWRENKVLILPERCLCESIKLVLYLPTSKNKGTITVWKYNVP